MARPGIILGAAVWRDGPSPTLRRRTLHAAGLYHSGEVNQLIACGGLGRYPPTEADVMAKLLQDTGVPDAAILREDRSTNTAENLRNAAAMLSSREVVIISDGYHLPRACLMARRVGLSPRGSAVRPPLQSMRKRAAAIAREVPAYIAYALHLR